MPGAQCWCSMVDACCSTAGSCLGKLSCACCLLTEGRRMFAAHCSILTAQHSLLNTAQYSLLNTHCSILLNTHCSTLTAQYLLLNQAWCLVLSADAQRSMLAAHCSTYAYCIFCKIVNLQTGFLFVVFVLFSWHALYSLHLHK